MYSIATIQFSPSYNIVEMLREITSAHALFASSTRTYCSVRLICEQYPLCLQLPSFT
jgi:hypothetical protein